MNEDVCGISKCRQPSDLFLMHGHLKVPICNKHYLGYMNEEPLNVPGRKDPIQIKVTKVQRQAPMNILDADLLSNNNKGEIA